MIIYIAKKKYIKNTLSGCKGFALMHWNKLLHRVYQDHHPKDLTNLYMVRNRVYRNRQWFCRRPILHAHLHHPVDGHIQLLDQFVSQRIMRKGLLETTFSVQSGICKYTKLKVKSNKNPDQIIQIKSSRSNNLDQIIQIK